MGRSKSETARAGVGIRVTKERLVPWGASGGFFALGLLSFAFIPLWIGWHAGPMMHGLFIDPDIITLVHLYVIGWGTTVALGALPQLSVVVFQAPDPGPARNAMVTLVLYAIGLMGLVGGMGTLRYEWAGVAGLLVLVALLMTLIGVWRSVRHRARASLIAPFVAVAMVSLVGAIIVGAFLALQRATGLWPAFRAGAFASHVYLGPLGWFGLLVPGISYELAPFFGLTHGRGDKGLGRYEKPVLLLLGIGLVGGLAFALTGMFHRLWFLPLIAGCFLFVYDLKGIYRSRPPVRRTAILTGVRAGHLWLVFLAVMLLAGVIRPTLWADGRWLVTFGWLALGGWISNSVAGYLHRILPFLVWHTKYWGVQKEDVRTRFPDMVSQRLGRLGFYIYNVGLALAVTGVWGLPLFQVGVGLFALGTWMLTYNLARAYFR